jgi:hypothetical protein
MSTGASAPGGGGKLTVKVTSKPPSNPNLELNPDPTIPEAPVANQDGLRPVPVALIPDDPSDLVTVLHDYSEGMVSLDPASQQAPFAGRVSNPVAPRLPFFPGDPWSVDYPRAPNIGSTNRAVLNALKNFRFKEILLEDQHKYFNPNTGDPNPQCFFVRQPDYPVYIKKGGLGTCLIKYKFYDGIPTLAHVDPKDLKPTYVCSKVFPFPMVVGEEATITAQRSRLFVVPSAFCKPLKWAVYQISSSQPDPDDQAWIRSDNKGTFPVPWHLLASVDKKRYQEARMALLCDYPLIGPLLQVRQTPLSVKQDEALYQANLQRYNDYTDRVTQRTVPDSAPSTTDGKDEDTPDTTASTAHLSYY